MNAIRPSRLMALTVALAVLAPASARADIFAAVTVAAPSPRTDFDIAIVNASLGTPVPLPAIVNTTASETHPSISSDGRRLVFGRTGGSDGVRRIVVDTSTGASADLFTGVEIAASSVGNSSISPDGSTVVTGRRFLRRVLANGRVEFIPQATRTDVRSFPVGPFPRSTLIAGGASFSTTGIVTDVLLGGNGLALFRLQTGTGPGRLLMTRPGNPPALLSRPTADFGYPVFAPNLFGTVVLFAQVSDPSGPVFADSNLVSRPANPTTFVGTPSLNFLGNTADDESQPARTADGRYLAFVRHSFGRDQLFVLDWQTLTFLNPSGVDLGRGSSRLIGSVSLYERAVITSSAITRSGTVNATLASAANIGIFVQRIVGKTKVFGRKAFEFETVGRVPLGSFGEGNVFTSWDFAVDGEPLPPGKYLVTLRAVEDTDAGTAVRELGEPQLLRIKKDGRIRVREYEVARTR